ncbi:ABC transporter permease [Pseudanabaena sp. FACHB-2040]|uniref:ABC transporter permease n=1 Tax=Pseudanabaena sp. FACHB-2040 TaxID=2692859 RepID=UPI00168A33B2|nr:ABC transporter permease [Pseudanabaena sp. FACHB-2040]MBD2260145.1 ABC transporter permease [Pseudanabaena sp. FACHB-2040]
MTESAPLNAAVGLVPTGSSPALLQRLWCDRIGAAALIVLIAIVLAVWVGPWLYPASPSEISFDRALLPPSSAYPFGTNDLGQDQLARILSGGRISLAVGVMAMAIAITLGLFVGSLAGFYGGWIDGGLMRLTDLFLSLPQLPLVLLVIYLFGELVRQVLGPEQGVFVLIVSVIGGLNWMSVARLVRAGFLSLKYRNFVQAAVALGANPWQLVRDHLLPNVVGPVTVAATLAVGNAILAESTLSFLGLGFSPDVPTWGRMLFDAQNYIEGAPHVVIFPGLAIFLTVLSINTVGDALRDILDPQGK